MAEATVRFDLGAESVTVHLPVDLPTGNPISGNLAGVLGDAHIVGDLNLTGNVYSEGLLTGIDTFHVQGNGFTWFFQNGGRADLHGKFKAPWGPWGTDSTGWMAGDRLAISATKKGIYVPSELAWSDWSMARPVNSPDFTPLGRPTRQPEVVNLSQSIVIENLARGFHFHDSAGVQSLSDVKFLNCGTTGVLGNYPVHFHMNSDNTRGTLLERVVVEGGKNHAFVPHGSHGITLRDCVAYNIIQDAYWWDPPESNNDPSLNDSDDVLYDHCLALKVNSPPNGPTAVRLAGFTLGRGNNNRCINSVASGIASGLYAGKSSSGFNWPEKGIAVWEFTGNVAHNNKFNGIFAWPNTHLDHVVEDFIAYNCGKAGIEQGAYVNRFKYRNVSITVGTPSAATAAVWQHANGQDTGLLFEDFITNDRLFIDSHGLPPTEWATHRRTQYTAVVYDEVQVGGAQKFPSWNRFEDTGLNPSDFTFTSIYPDSKIEIVESGVLVHSWAGGWT